MVCQQLVFLCDTAFITYLFTGRKNKQWSTKTTQNTKYLATHVQTELKTGWTQVLWNGKQFLLHMWHRSCYSGYNSGDKSWFLKGQHCHCNYHNVSVVVCDRYSYTVDQVMVATVKLKSDDFNITTRNHFDKNAPWLIYCLSNLCYWVKSKYCNNKKLASTANNMVYLPYDWKSHYITNYYYLLNRRLNIPSWDVYLSSLWFSNFINWRWQSQYWTMLRKVWRYQRGNQKP